MPFTVPTFAELTDFLVAQAKALFPDMVVSRTSFPAILAKLLAAGATDNHAHIESVRADLLPDTAEGEALDRWGAITGVPRKGSTPARKSNALRLINSSDGDVLVDQGLELVHSSGLRFKLNESDTVPAGDQGDFDVVAIDTGSKTRLAAGEILTFVIPIAGIEENTELQLALDEDGDDTELDGDYRRRVLSRFATPPLGGAQNDYVTWALQITGIAAAYAYPNRAGLGTVDVAALHKGTGSARLLNPSERDELLAHLNEERPVHATVRVLEVLEEGADIEILISSTGEARYAWDWIDQTPMTVSAWNAGTRTLTFTAPLPDTMQASHRIVIKKLDGTGDGAPVAIESLASSAAVVLEDAPSSAPVSTDLVYSGGELTVPVRNAILAHINSLGTANPDGNPYGTWEGTLRVADIEGAAKVDGVRDRELVVPVANVEPLDPAFPDDDTIYLLTPGRVLIRRKW